MVLRRLLVERDAEQVIGPVDPYDRRGQDPVGVHVGAHQDGRVTQDVH